MSRLTSPTSMNLTWQWLYSHPLPVFGASWNSHFFHPLAICSPPAQRESVRSAPAPDSINSDPSQLLYIFTTPELHGECLSCLIPSNRETSNSFYLQKYKARTAGRSITGLSLSDYKLCQILVEKNSHKESLLKDTGYIKHPCLHAYVGKLLKLWYSSL